jgi:replicative DNA helicase
MQINICVLSQINRGVESRTSRRPVMSDLSESGKIEESASRIFLLYREDAYDYDSKAKGIAEVNLAKNRFGATGVAQMAFVKELTLFADLV